MSLPESEKELLLSASIDGALSPEEQEMLERWFREDPAAQKRLDELAGLVSNVRDAYRPLQKGGKSHRQLGRDFAESIVDRAIAQAMAEDLPTTHPLVRIGQGEKVSLPSGGTDSRHWRRLSLAAAIAAAVLGGVFVATRGGNQDDLGSSLGLISQSVDQPIGNDLASPVPAIDPAGPELPAEMIASALPDRLPVTENGTDINSPVPTIARSVPNASSVPPKMSDGRPDAGDIALQVPRSTDSAMAATPSNAAAPDRPTADKPTAAEPADAVQLAAVMVVSVELTQQGRESLALLMALRAADIRLGANGIVSDQVVNELRQSAVVQTPQESQPANLYFIEAPARQIDKFLMQVLDDKQSFASIGLGISDSKPLLASIGRWRPSEAEKDASNNPVGQSLASGTGQKAVARDLVSSDGKPLNIDRGDAVIQMDRTMGTAGFMMPPASAATNSGKSTVAKDFTAQMILLVH